MIAKLITIKDRRNLNSYKRNQREARGKTDVFSMATQPVEPLGG